VWRWARRERAFAHPTFFSLYCVPPASIEIAIYRLLRLEFEGNIGHCGWRIACGQKDTPEFRHQLMGRAHQIALFIRLGCYRQMASVNVDGTETEDQYRRAIRRILRFARQMESANTS